jgi:hypothetical protein
VEEESGEEEGVTPTEQESKDIARGVERARKKGSCGTLIFTVDIFWLDSKKYSWQILTRIIILFEGGNGE